MKKTLLLALLIITITFTSCNHKDIYYTIRGRIVKDCSGAPYGDKEITLNQHAPSLISAWSGDVYISKNTNTWGYFAITYNGSDCVMGENLSLYCILDYLPTHQNIDIGTILYQPTCNIVYRLKVNNPHTSNDTLYCTDLEERYSSIKISGPFQDTVLGLFNVKSPTVLEYETKDYSFFTAGWDIVSNSHTIKGTETTIQVHNCNSKPDTLTLIIN